MRTFFLLLLCCISIPVFSSYKGTVYFQKDIMSSLRYTLEGVVVTDGQNVVKTDKQGRFILPGYNKSRFITVTTPAGYSTAEYYIPIDKTIQSYDFILLEDEKTRNTEHSFIHITDTEVHGTGTGVWTSFLKNYIDSESPAFLVHTGDICYENGLKMHKKTVNSHSMGIPVYYTIGNHDLVNGRYGEELFESIYGPTWFSFDVGDTHYVVTPMPHGDHRPSYNKEEVYKWLVNDLNMMKEGQSLVMFNHDVLTTGNDFIFDDGKNNSINLRNYNLKAWVYGHWHYNYVRNQDGVYTICTSTIDKGGIDHSTSAFRVITTNKDASLTSHLRYVYNEPQVAIVSPMNNQSNPVLSQGKLPISVNVYNSNSEVKEIKYTIREPESNDIAFFGTIDHRRTDWNWYEEVELAPDVSGKRMQLDVVAVFNNQEKAYASAVFVYDRHRKSEVREGEAWTTLLQNAQHTGRSNSTVGASLKLEWANNVGANIYMTSPVIAESKVFIASTDDNINPQSSVVAFDLVSGQLLWKFPTRNSVKNSIAYEGGVVVAQDAEGHLYAIDAGTGKLLWESYLNSNRYPYLSEGLTASNGVVYAGTGNDLSAYEIKTGKKLWQNKGWKKNEAATTTLTVAGDVLIAGSQWGALYANDLRTGEFLWKISEDGMSDRGASPTYQDGKLYVVSRKSLFIINPQDGSIIKREELPYNLDATSTPLIMENEIIVGTGDRGVICLNKDSYSMKWNLSTNPSLVYSVPYTSFPAASVETSVVTSGDIAYFGASDGYLYVINSADGIIYQKINLGTPLFSTVALSGNTLIVSDYGGNIYAFTSDNL